LIVFPPELQLDPMYRINLLSSCSLLAAAVVDYARRLPLMTLTVRNRWLLPREVG
jgi:hypothetical protein